MSTENIENELQLVYRELDELGLRVEKLEVFHLHGFPEAGSLEEFFGDHPNPYPPPEPLNEARPEREAQIPQSEGHPIPEYNEKQCEVLFKAVFKNADKIKTAEAYLIDCVYDYLDHHASFNDGPMGEKTLREWGHEDYRLHSAMKEAAKELSDL